MDVILTITADIEDQSFDGVEADVQAQEDETHQVKTHPELLEAKRLEGYFGVLRDELEGTLKKGAALFWSPDREFRCVVPFRRGTSGKVSRIGMISPEMGRLSSWSQRKLLHPIVHGSRGRICAAV
jgi:hypothetical protein